MKAAAVDCELNVKQNRDGSFICLPLGGRVGDFLYHPDLATDIVKSGSEFDIPESAFAPEKPLEPPPAVLDVGGPAALGAAAAAPAAAAAAAPPAAPKPKVAIFKYKGTEYRMRQVLSDTGEVTGYEMFAKDDEDFETILGRTGAKAGKPAPPVTMV